MHSIAQGLARDQLKTEPFRHPGANCHWIPIPKPILGRKEEYVGKGMGGAITGNGERAEEENEGDPPT